MSNCKEIGANVRRLRKRAGLSQERLALEAGVSNSYLRLIEHGNANPTIHELEKVASALGVPLASLVMLPEPAEAAL